ncbi:hypothetical protein V3C99_000554, partial [Haemonchus contortus]|uniref:Inhibitor I9 domain-containing protein n=2 Tax=Haemonchus contortus TaxID=6289 RepID=A0A7I4YFR7_HAECO
QVPMLRLVAFVCIIALSLACAPQENPGKSDKSDKSDKKTTPASSSKTTKGSTKGKREVGQARVTLVTYQDFDEEMTPFYLEAVRSVVEHHEESSGILYNPKLINVKAENIGGKFAAVYTILGVDCDELHRFISTINGLSALTEQVTITCGGRTTVL